MKRQAEVTRKTRETDISIVLGLDGAGDVRIATQYPFLTHMLELFGYHGYFDLTVRAEGDVEVDTHHLVEDVGLALGSAFAKALGSRRGIRRYASALVPMDEVLVACAVDISSRPLFVSAMNGESALERRFSECFCDFFRSFSTTAGLTLHLQLLSAGGWHHVMEAMFKALALVLDQATSLETRRDEVPSTKGQLGTFE